MIVASETAEFGQPEILLGIIPGGGGTQRLARTIGKQRAMELVLTGRRIDAHEAYRLGLVNQVTKKKEWLQRAVELADVAARRPAARGGAWPPAGGPPRQAGRSRGRRDRPSLGPRVRATAIRAGDGDRGPGRGDHRFHREAAARLQGSVTELPQAVAVVGAGTMGAGIAQLA